MKKKYRTNSIRFTVSLASLIVLTVILIHSLHKKCKNVSRIKIVLNIVCAIFTTYIYKYNSQTIIFYNYIFNLLQTGLFRVNLNTIVRNLPYLLSLHLYLTQIIICKIHFGLNTDRKS